VWPLAAVSALRPGAVQQPEEWAWPSGRSPGGAGYALNWLICARRGRPAPGARTAGCQAPPERGADPAGQFEGLRRSPEWGTDLGSQVEALRKQGSRVEVITPDADSRAAFGTNQTDPATRIPAARAGFAQGKQEATRVTFL